MKPSDRVVELAKRMWTNSHYIPGMSAEEVCEVLNYVLDVGCDDLSKDTVAQLSVSDLYVKSAVLRDATKELQRMMIIAGCSQIAITHPAEGNLAMWFNFDEPKVVIDTKSYMQLAVD